MRVRGGRQIRDEGQAARIHCPGELVLEGGKRGKCNILVDEAVVEKLLKAGPAPDTALLSKYRKRLVEGSAPLPPPPPLRLHLSCRRVGRLGGGGKLLIGALVTGR